MKPTTAQRFGSLGKSFGAPSAAAAVIGAALLASDTSDTSETAWSPAAACLLPDVLPVAGTLLSYGGSRQLAAGGTVTHSGALSIGANALTCGAITASGKVQGSYFKGGAVGSGLAPIVQFPVSGSYQVGIYSPASYQLAFGMTEAGDGGAASAAYLGLLYDFTTAALSWGMSTRDVMLARHSTGPALNVQAAGGLRVLNLAGSADAALTCGAITASGTIQETPTQSALDPTTTNIPSGKRQGWYNTALSEFRDWVNIGGTLLKSAAYT